MLRTENPGDAAHTESPAALKIAPLSIFLEPSSLHEGSSGSSAFSHPYFKFRISSSMPCGDAQSFVVADKAYIVSCNSQ